MTTARSILLLTLAALGCARDEQPEKGHDEDRGMLKVGQVGQEVVLRGTASDAKAGAVVVTPEGPVYIDGLGNWPSEVTGKAVEVTGVLRSRKLIPDAGTEPVTAGAPGTQLVIENPRWKVH